MAVGKYVIAQSKSYWSNLKLIWGLRQQAAAEREYAQALLEQVQAEHRYVQALREQAVAELRYEEVIAEY